MSILTPQICFSLLNKPSNNNSYRKSSKNNSYRKLSTWGLLVRSIPSLICLQFWRISERFELTLVFELKDMDKLPLSLSGDQYRRGPVGPLAARRAWAVRGHVERRPQAQVWTRPASSLSDKLCISWSWLRFRPGLEMMRSDRVGGGLGHVVLYSDLESRLLVCINWNK